MTDLKKVVNNVRNHRSQSDFSVLVTHFESRVFTICLRIMRNREEAEEAAQDAFVRCYQKINQLEDVERFEFWLMRIAYHTALDRLRLKRNKKTFQIDVEIGQLMVKEDADSAKLGETERIEKALAKLGKEEVTIITLYYQEGFSIEEIGKLMNLTKSNVKIKLFRARNRLRQILQKGKEQNGPQSQKFQQCI